MRHFTSDLHFGHDKIIDYCDRPFNDLDHMHTALISRWNMTVGVRDEVYVLGDVALYLRKNQMAEILAELNGVKHLVKGNHDHRDVYKAVGWASVQEYDSTVRLTNGTPVHLLHDPFRLHLHNPFASGLVLHGHLHGRKGRPELHPPRLEGCAFLDVGVDCEYADYRPISEVEIINILNRR